MDYAEAFLLDQVSLAQRSLIPATLKTAYVAAMEAIKEQPIFNVPSAVDNWGRIIQWSVDREFERLAQSGRWPFDYVWRRFERPTGSYLEILPSHCIITISQVADPKKQPRDVRFRENKRLSGQAWLAGLPKPDDDAASSGLPHVLLLHGHQELHFAHLGLPRGAHQDGFHYQTPNLMLTPHAVVQPELPVEDTDYEAVMTLKEEIDRWRKDNAG
jgi:hypothetical protein